MTDFDLVYFALKGPLANLWPVVVFPLLAALACELAARQLPATRADWRLAAALAAAPGLLCFALGSFMLWRIATHPHWTPDPSHLFKYQGAGLCFLAVLGRTAWRAWQRSNAVAAIVALARHPSQRLASAGRRAGVEVRLLPVADRECFVAGIARPTVYISAGALECLTDAELDATLRHERSHIVGHDTAMLAGLCFLGDLVPSGKTALTAYLQSRERTADEQAALSSGPVVLASALLTLARKQPRPLPAIAMAGTVAPAWRLKAILDCEEAADQGHAGFAGLAALAFTVVWVAWPTAQSYIIDHFCSCHL